MAREGGEGRGVGWGEGRRVADASQSGKGAAPGEVEGGKEKGEEWREGVAVDGSQ